MVEEQLGMKRGRWQKNSKIIWIGVDGRRIARYGEGQMVEEQEGTERGRWQKNSKVWRGVDGRKLQGMEEGWARN